MELWLFKFYTRCEKHLHNTKTNMSPIMVCFRGPCTCHAGIYTPGLPYPASSLHCTASMALKRACSICMEWCFSKNDEAHFNVGVGSSAGPEINRQRRYESLDLVLWLNGGYILSTAHLFISRQFCFLSALKRDKPSSWKCASLEQPRGVDMFCVWALLGGIKYPLAANPLGVWLCWYQWTANIRLGSCSLFGQVTILLSSVDWKFAKYVVWGLARKSLHTAVSCPICKSFDKRIKIESERSTGPWAVMFCWVIALTACSYFPQ
jgi:hypothetical protein